jgi:hypothetical protein
MMPFFRRKIKEEKYDVGEFYDLKVNENLNL